MLSQLLIINSKDRVSGPAENFIYNMEYYSPVEVQEMRINKISIPYSIYTTPAQTLTIAWAVGIVSPTTYTLNVPAGIYTPATLVIELQALSDAAIGVGKIIWSYTNNLFTVQTADVFHNILVSWNINGLGPSYQYLSLGVQMGFVLEGTTYVPPPFSTGANDIFTASYFANLAGTPNFYVTSTYLQLFQSSYFNRVPGNVVQSVPIQVNPFNMIVWQNSVPTNFKTNSTVNFNNIDFQLIDEYGNIINLNGLNWSIEIQIFYNITS